MKKLAILALAALAVAACNKDRIPDQGRKEGEFILHKCTTPFNSDAAWLGVQNEYYPSIAALAKNISPSLTEKTGIVFVTREAMAGVNKKDVIQAVNNGAIVVAFNPDFDKIGELIEEQSWPIMYSPCDNALFFALSLKGSYLLEKPEKNWPTTERTERTSERIPEPEDHPGKEGEIDYYKGVDFSKLEYFIEPFVNWVNSKMATKGAKFTNAITFSDQKTIPVDWQIHKFAFSDPDKIKGNYEVIVTCTCEPAYRYSANASQQNQNGDYYMMNVQYISGTSGVFAGDKVDHKHGGCHCKMSGAFLHYYTAKTEIVPNGSYTVEFLSGDGFPTPESDINTTTYSKQAGWNIGGGVTVGGSVSEKQGAGGKAGASFNWGYNQNSTITYSLSDLSVKNQASGNKVAQWTFTCQNLPKATGDNKIDRNTPEVASSTKSFDTQWAWHVSGTKDNTTNSVGKIKASIDVELGCTKTGYCVADETKYLKLGTVVLEWNLCIPHRRPFGTVKLENTFPEGTTITDVQISKGDVVYYQSKSDILSGKSALFNIDKNDEYLFIFNTVKDRQMQSYEYYYNNSNKFNVSARTSEKDIITVDAYNKSRKRVVE